MKNLEYKGIWWTPNNPEITVSGTLVYTENNGSNLEIIGTFNKSGEDNYNIILGKTINGKDITLHNCLTINESFNSNELTITNIFAHTIFDGVHFNTNEDIEFDEISCHYSNVDEWAGFECFKITNEKKGQVIRYRYPKSICAGIDNNYAVEVFAKTSFSSSSFGQKEINIVQKIYVKVKNKNLNSFEDHVEMVQHMGRFISLGIGEPIIQFEMIGQSPANKREYDDNIIYPDIKIYPYVKNESVNNRQVHRYNMLFNLKEIEDHFEVHIKKWFDNKELLNPINNLYFGTIYNREMFLEQRFLSLVQALESYHRRTRNNSEVEDEKHKIRIDSVLNSVHREHREWLKSKLRYSNEPGLRKRLKELFAGIDIFENLESSKKRRLFISKICDTRNYLTHYDVTLRKNSFKDKELVAVCEELKVIILFCLLVETGLDTSYIKEKIKKKYERYELFKLL
ncbi:MAG: hypothetical protein JJE17_03425 [Peptostreptococcaceae bacterium]|nr:hypothetical protein [Peptostreptococcaceae bacterium]